MTTTCKDLVDSYLEWLRDKITVASIGDYCEITTPFLDRHNDRIQIFVESIDNGLRLTDDGYIIADLEASGCPIGTENRRRILGEIIQGFGIQERDGELFTEASETTFPQKKHALIQAMLAVNDMFMTSKQHVATLFLEDVSNFLDDHHVRYSPSVGFMGKSGFLQRFDFLITKSQDQPERLIKAINNPTRSAAGSELFAWTDTKGTRPPDSRFLVFLNDSEKRPGSNIMSAFEEYGVEIILWSRREDFAGILAA